MAQVNVLKKHLDRSQNDFIVELKPISKQKNPPMGDDTIQTGISMPGQRDGIIAKSPRSSVNPKSKTKTLRIGGTTQPNVKVQVAIL
jgi:hypothetical protein